ncbi:MAG: nitronate monooxygenase [Gemmatimonadaceae bacterium]
MITGAESIATAFTRQVGIEVPLICGAMYPCSNPELVAAASEAGAIGVVQPISLTYVHGHEYRAGLRLIRSLTSKPIGLNALIEQSSKLYRERMEKWIEVALEEGVRFFVTSLGNPKWVVKRVESVGGMVYHDVTERKWAQKAVDGGVHGLIGVNARAGGHAGTRSAERLLDEVSDFGLPVICAGGIGGGASFAAALQMGYAGAQLGTRFIATTECIASDAYKRAIVSADATDIVLTERITGVPVAVINTPFIQRIGTTIGPIARRLFRGRKTKHWMRSYYALRSLRQLKKASLDEKADYWQAGKSVSEITAIEPVAQIVRELASAAMVAAANRG